MRSFVVVLAVSFAVVVAPRPSHAGEVRNDDWQPAQPALFPDQLGLLEIAAARLVPDEPCPCELTAVAFLYGGASAVRSVTVRVWDDSAGSLAPGSELYWESIEVTADDDVLQFVDLSAVPAEPIVVDGPFRVGIAFIDEGRPTVGADADGTNADDRNFLYTGGQWTESADAGVDGDWIIRAQVVSLAEPLCSQPVTGGSGPEASDCHFLLRVAVGSETCDPVCICDPNGSGATTTNDALLCLRSSVGLDVPLECPCG